MTGESAEQSNGTGVSVAAFSLSADVQDEYDPGRPNDYTEIVKAREQQRRQAQEEAVRQERLKQEAQEEQERQVSDQAYLCSVRVFAWHEIDR